MVEISQEQREQAKKFMEQEEDRKRKAQEM